MPQELNGYGPTAGENLGGTGANLNERPDTSTPGGDSHGNGGDRDTGGTSSSSGNATNNWAGPGPINLAVLNAAIAEAIKHGLPRGTVAATSTPAYKVLRAALDALPLSQQPAAQDQITQAWQRAHDAMPDKVTTQYETAGSNHNQTITTIVINEAKQTLAQAVSQVLSDMQNALAEAKVKAEAEAKAVAEAKAKAEAEAKAVAEAKAKAEAEAKAAAEAKAKAEAEAKAKLAELMAKAGVKPTPVYTPDMIKSAQASLAAAGGMVLNRAPGMMQLSTVARGVLTTASEVAGSTAGALWRGITELSRIATVSTVGATVGTLVIGFWPKEVGLGSDQIIGRDMELFAAQAQLFAAGKVNITPEMTSVNLPVRGMLVTENGRQHVALVKTGVAGVSANVPVLRAVRDEKTGLDKITLPAVGGIPSRTILINPVPVGPTAPPHTGNSAPAPVTPVHTGTTIKPADSIVTTTFPADDLKEIQDFIYWQLDASGSGVEAIYVMLSGPYGETNAKGEYSGRDYNTDKAGGPIQNLDWKGTKIDRAGVDKVKLHAGRFGESPDNKVMIDRLEKILKGELQVTDTDKRFYTHEIRELERYRNLGVKDGEIPENYDEVWNNTHTATLEDYKVNEKNQPLYTPEAEDAYWKAEEGK